MAALLTTRPADYVVLELALPGRAAVNWGVMLFDPAMGRLDFKVRSDTAELADPEDAEVIEGLAEQFRLENGELGGKALLERLEDSLSGVLRISERRRVEFRDFRYTLARLFDEHVLGVVREPARVIPFVTHLPLYSLRAAAGRFGQDMEVEAEPEDWIEAPADLRLTPDMFAVHVTGRSMEPQIPDGSLALFRFNPPGTRQGKKVLVWKRAASEAGGEFTLKVYHSRKGETPDDTWHHEGIRLEPLNPEYEPLELDETASYQVLGAFVRLMAEG